MSTSTMKRRKEAAAKRIRIYTVRYPVHLDYALAA